MMAGSLPTPSRSPIPAGFKTIATNANSTINGTITNNDSTGGLVLGTSTRTLTVGLISGTGSRGVTFGSSALTGTVTLTGSSNYTGDTRIDSSTLGITGTGAIPAGGNLVFQGSGTATFDVNGTTQTVAGLNDSVLAGAIRSTAANGKLIVGDSNDSTFRGVMSTANLALEKVGTGKLTLSGSNTYSGGTTVSAGSLLVNGSLTNSAVTVGSGGTLGGSGTLGALVAVQLGGVLSPGNSPGILAAAELDLQAGSTTLMQVIGSGSAAGTAGTDYDQVQITTASSLTYGGELVLSFINSPLFDNGTLFSLLQFTGTARGGFTSVRTEGTGSYSGLTLQYNSNGNWYTNPNTAAGQYLVLSPASGQLAIVPEPSTWVMAAIGAGLVALKARRRKRADASLAA